MPLTVETIAQLTWKRLSPSGASWRVGQKVDKKNRSSLELCPSDIDHPRSEPDPEPWPRISNPSLSRQNSHSEELIVDPMGCIDPAVRRWTLDGEPDSRNQRPSCLRSSWSNPYGSPGRGPNPGGGTRRLEAAS